MTGPGNGIADADRERVIETLKVAFVQERLTREELDARIGDALGARSGAELAVLTADLPGGLAALPPPTREARLSKEVRERDAGHARRDRCRPGNSEAGRPAAQDLSRAADRGGAEDGAQVSRQDAAGVGGGDHAVGRPGGGG
jgi:Domain of unknown function (DUF1707)